EQQAEVQRLCQGCYDAMNDDINTAVVIAQLFNLSKKINQLYTKQIQTATLGEAVFNQLKVTFVGFMGEVLGLLEERTESSESLIDGMLMLYKEYKAQKLYDKVDQVRTYFKANGLVIKDMKDQIDWAYEE
ncbi:MAG: cysteine--tRNA ligase, partial [Bacteroidetes bacterium]|nr:cysteine--tRNA ligase [Fibrella sp.]